jgi:hypothetical protein
MATYPIPIFLGLLRTRTSVTAKIAMDTGKSIPGLNSIFSP